MSLTRLKECNTKSGEFFLNVAKGDYCIVELCLIEECERGKSLRFTPILTNILMHLEFKAGTSRNAILTQLPRLSLRCVTPSGAMCEPHDWSESWYPSTTKVPRRRTHWTVLLLSTTGDWNRMEGISESAWSFAELIYWKLMTFLDCDLRSTGLFIVNVATNIYSTFLSSQSHNGGKGVGEGVSNWYIVD